MSDEPKLFTSLEQANRATDLMFDMLPIIEMGMERVKRVQPGEVFPAEGPNDYDTAFRLNQMVRERNPNWELPPVRMIKPLFSFLDAYTLLRVCGCHAAQTVAFARSEWVKENIPLWREPGTANPFTVRDCRTGSYGERSNWRIYPPPGEIYTEDDYQYVNGSFSQMMHVATVAAMQYHEMRREAANGGA